jgi:D-xylose transport system permease protein
VTVEAPPVVPGGNGFATLVRERLEAFRGGEVGSVPIIIALVAIALFFYTRNENFLSAGNFNNLIVQMAGVTIIAYGVVFVLLIGEIDLSIAFVSGIAGVIVAKLQIPDGNWEITGVAAILIAVAACALIGAGQGSIVAKVGVPSFAITLAGLLFWQGVILKSIGTQGVIGIEDETLINVANYFFADAVGWTIAGVIVAVYAASSLWGVVDRRRHGITGDYLPLVAFRIAVVAAAALFVVYVCNQERGFPFAGLLMLVLLVFWTYVAKRTTFGRHVYAVGGNAEAARRAGINVARVRIAVFMISGAMAGLGGVVLASRLASVDLDVGGGTLLIDAIAAAVIGGVSLFGGRGEVLGAFLGSLVIASVANGIDLVGYESSVKYMVTGAILAAAVTLDSFLRRRQVATGR